MKFQWDGGLGPLRCAAEPGGGAGGPGCAFVPRQRGGCRGDTGDSTTFSVQTQFSQKSWIHGFMDDDEDDDGDDDCYYYILLQKIVSY